MHITKQNFIQVKRVKIASRMKQRNTFSSEVSAFKKRSVQHLHQH